MKGVPFSESSPNVQRIKINAANKSPRKGIKSLAEKKLKMKKKGKAGMKSLFADKGVKIKKRVVVQEGGVQKKKVVLASGAPKAALKKKSASSGDYASATICTRAAVRRIAAKHNIPQMSADCVSAIIKHITAQTEECLLKARSSARHVSRTRTIQVPDLASAARSCQFGDLIHA